MAFTTINRTIAAPRARVFDTIAHIENFSKAVPDIIETEFLSEQKRGVGTRFRETRLMGKRKASTILEVTEYVENERIRLVSDAGGAKWDSLFAVRDTEDGGTQLDFEMDAEPYKFLAKIMIKLFRGMISKAISKDMDSVKVHCENTES